MAVVFEKPKMLRDVTTGGLVGKAAQDCTQENKAE